MSAAKRRDAAALGIIRDGGWVALTAPDGTLVAGPFHDESALLAALAQHPNATARLHETPLRVRATKTT